VVVAAWVARFASPAQICERSLPVHARAIFTGRGSGMGTEGALVIFYMSQAKQDSGAGSRGGLAFQDAPPRGAPERKLCSGGPGDPIPTKGCAEGEG
jgi:hypothetical protein